jgi:hypothetical protein
VLKHCKYATVPPADTGLAVAEAPALALIIRYMFPSAASENTERSFVPAE